MHWRLAVSSGLVWHVNGTPGPSTALAPDLSAPATGSVRSVARRFEGQPFTAEWRGLLLPGSGDRYRFLVEADDTGEVFLDGRLVANEKMVAGGWPVLLDRRQHDLLIRYADRGGDQRLDIQWAQGDGHFRPLPALLLVPERISIREVDLRRVMVRASLALPLIGVAVLTFAAAFGIRAVIGQFGSAPGTAPAFWSGRNAALAVGALLFTAGLWWGVPGPASWPPDEIGPADVWSALHAGFSNRWSSIYPPFHHALIGFFYLPFEAAFALRIGDREDVVWSGALLLVARSLSLFMALGIVWAAHRIALEQFGSRAATIAAWLTLAALPLAFYAKTANTDVPYVFWLSLSLLFFARARTEAVRAADFYLFTLFGVVAVCTKDQAYGFFVLPAIYMLVGGLLGIRRPGIPRRPVLVGMAVLAIAAFTLLHNLTFNFSGFMDHVRSIAGPGRAYQMFPNTAAGHMSLALTSLIELGHAVSWPVFAIAGTALLSAVRHRSAQVLWLLLPCVSYYLTFIAVVRYQYDRFFLGVMLVFALIAAWGLDHWLPRPRPRPWQATLIIVSLVYVVARAVALDLMMLRDPRHDAERWLRAHVGPGQHVAAIGHDALLPRSSIVPWRPMRPHLALLQQERPQFVIVNIGFSLRAEEGSAARELYAALESGAAGYRRAARFQHAAPPPLSWERRFRRMADDPFTNLTKVNPVIDVYVRGGVAVESAELEERR